ncbi:Increased loss of mitochondrial DNA protein 1 [Penicillium herquei]|nr:Increased loss of mitochondrial DNA protein 1 [Penicillium herquei]
MVLVSSKTLIQVHGVLLIILAGYLVKSPESITDSNIVFMMGETLKIDLPPPKSPLTSPFVFCSIFLFAEAFIDLVLLTTLPYRDALNDALPYIRPLRNSNLPSEDLRALEKLPEYITTNLTLYWNVWISITGARLAMYAAISLFIYQSKDSFVASSYAAASAVTGLDRLKNRAVFTYAFLEMMFWFWSFITLREERQERLTKLLEDARDN